jgi:integrase
MSCYFIKGWGWRYELSLNGSRFTGSGFATKKEAQEAEAKRKEELTRPAAPKTAPETPTDMDFLTLVNRRLDHVKVYSSERHYTDHLYLAKKWVKEWQGVKCSEIKPEMIESYLIRRVKKTSAFTANKDLRLLRAVFNYGMHPTRNWIVSNPTRGIQFFPVDKRIKYVPPREDVLRVILAANPDTQDYLWTIALTMGRMSEINRLTWEDVNLEQRYVVLYTRKKRGGHRTPRKVPMADKLFELLSRRFKNRDKRIPWVFWHRYWSRKEQETVAGPYLDRNRIMEVLCEKAGVRYFRFHALRHFGASMLEQSGVPVGSIQRLLGHENRTTTELYLHSIGDSERRAIEVLGGNFSENSHNFPTKMHKGLQIEICNPLI